MSLEVTNLGAIIPSKNRKVIFKINYYLVSAYKYIDFR
jgi:hypothetical protein